MSSAPPNALGAVPPVVAMSSTMVWVMVWPAMSLTRTEFGSVTMAWVTPAGVGLVRKLFATARLYSGNPFAVPGGGGGSPILKGTVLAGAMWGGPGDLERAALDQDGGAVRDRGHPDHARWLIRVRGGRHIQPDAWLQVDRAAVAAVADLLQVVEAEELDVVLGGAAVRYRAADAAEMKLLFGGVQLQEELAAPLEVRPRDEVESVPPPVPREFLQWPELLEESFYRRGCAERRNSVRHCDQVPSGGMNA